MNYTNVENRSGSASSLLGLHACTANGVKSEHEFLTLLAAGMALLMLASPTCLAGLKDMQEESGHDEKGQHARA